MELFKGYNFKWHYMQKHAAKFNAYEGLCHKDIIVELKKVCLLNKKLVQKVSTQGVSIVKASYTKASYVAYLIAKKSKSFTDGEFIKQCIESMTGKICPEKKGIFLKSIFLTRL